MIWIVSFVKNRKNSNIDSCAENDEYYSRYRFNPDEHIDSLIKNTWRIEEYTIIRHRNTGDHLFILHTIVYEMNFSRISK